MENLGKRLRMIIRINNYTMKEEQIDSIIRLIKREVVPAIGCTEPAAVSLCVAKATETLGRCPEKISLKLSGNIIKNAMGSPVHLFCDKTVYILFHLFKNIFQDHFTLIIDHLTIPYSCTIPQNTRLPPSIPQRIRSRRSCRPERRRSGQIH